MGGDHGVKVIDVVRLGVHRHVHDTHTRPHLPGKGIGRCPIGEEGAHHLSRHLRRIRRRARSARHAVIASDDDEHGSLRGRGRALAAHRGPPRAQGLQAAECPLGLGQLPPAGGGFLRYCSIGPVDARDDVSDDVGA